MPKSPVAIALVDPPLLSLSAVARRLSVSTRTVRRLIDAGELQALRVGGQIRVDPVALDAYLGEGARQA